MSVAPEKLQAYGIASRDALATLVLKKNVMVIPKAVDDYGRVVAQLRLGEADVSEMQLRRGMAWENSRFHNDKALLAIQTEARRARRGLWASPNPLPPSEFRKTHTTVDVASSDNPACGIKRYCSQMRSCEEATLYLTQCHIKTLDKDGDGVPCENLCKGKLR